MRTRHQSIPPRSPAPPSPGPPASGRWIFASSLGTLFEWYDFYLYGHAWRSSSAASSSRPRPHGPAAGQPRPFGAGFTVRPLGALVFGHIGDLIGRKYTFPGDHGHHGPVHGAGGAAAHLRQHRPLGHDHPGAAAAAQGLALGGEYGGAATYVAEHVPDARRGYYTSYIQTTATLGFFASMAVIGVTRWCMGEDGFKGVRRGYSRLADPVPALLPLLAVSLYIRLELTRKARCSPSSRPKARSPRTRWRKAPTNPVNLRYVLLALFAPPPGQGVMWSTGQFYALTFLSPCSSCTGSRPT